MLRGAHPAEPGGPPAGLGSGGPRAPMRVRDTSLSLGRPASTGMSSVLPELFAAVVIVGLASVNAAVPGAAWGRSRDFRFLLVSAANGFLAVVGVVWAWGLLPDDPPSWARVAWPVELLVLAVVLLLLLSTVWPRAR